MSPDRRGRGDVAGMGRRTSPCMTSVLNLGNSPRVPVVRVAEDKNEEEEAGKKSLPVERDERDSRPSHTRIMQLLSMAIIPEERGAFRRRFRNASGDEDGRCCEFLCHTPISVVAKAFGCEPFPLRSAADMFPESRTESEFLNEFYILDVILNRAPSPAVTPGDDKKVENDSVKSTEVDYDTVRPVISYEPGHQAREMDHLYRAAILFLPQCGVFYCHRERRRGDVGVAGTLTAHDMSWLRLRREVSSPQTNCGVSYTFGQDSFVRRFFSEYKGRRVYCGPPHNGHWHYLDAHSRVSAWRISTGYRHCSLQNRVVHRVHQCHDADGPMVAPDFIGGDDKRTVPSDYRAAAYQELLLCSNSAKKDGRHYVDGCWYYELPESCWIVDPMETHFVDIVVDIDMGEPVVGGTRNRESVIMIRNVTKIDAHDDHLKLLEQLTLGCAQLRVSEAKGTARAKSADVGTMFAIGTRIPYERRDHDSGAPRTAPYAANGCVSEGLLRNLVVDMATIGSRSFPQVYSVIRDTEGNSSLLPVPPMDGEALPAPSHRVGSEGQTTGHSADVTATDLREGSLVKGECRRRVGYTIDMSVNLGNSSHFDVHDASQGFAVWTEEVPGCGENWFFVLPNVHGLKPDGVTKFRGMAVKLGHGVAISWDGRVIRHCTSVSHPDGMEYGRVGEVKDSHFRNHLYGTFTAAKERIVRAGRAEAAASDCCLNSDDMFPPERKPPEKKARKRLNKRRRRNRKGERSVVPSDAKDDIAVVPRVGNPASDPPCFANSTITGGGERRFRVDKRELATEAVGGSHGLRTALSGKCAAVRNFQLEIGDLDVGVGYKIPRKRKLGTEQNNRSSSLTHVYR